MTNKISINLSSSALADIDLITSWYQKQSLGLSLKFISEIQISLDKITNFPQAYGAYGNHISVRRFTMKVFPYIIFYYYLPFHVEVLSHPYFAFFALY